MTAFISATPTSWPRLGHWRCENKCNICAFICWFYVTYHGLRCMFWLSELSHSGRRRWGLSRPRGGKFRSELFWFVLKTETWSACQLCSVLVISDAKQTVFPMCHRRRRWWNRSCCTSRPGCIVVELLKWSCRPSVWAEVQKNKWFICRMVRKPNAFKWCFCHL